MTKALQAALEAVRNMTPCGQKQAMYRALFMQRYPHGLMKSDGTAIHEAADAVAGMDETCCYDKFSEVE